MNEESRRRKMWTLKVLLGVASLHVLLHGGFYLGMRTGVVGYGSFSSPVVGYSGWSAILLATLAIFAYFRFGLGKWVVVVGLIAAPMFGALLYWALYGSLSWWQLQAIESNLKDPTRQMGVGVLVAILVVLLVIAPAIGVWTSRRMARQQALGSPQVEAR